MTTNFGSGPVTLKRHRNKGLYDQSFVAIRESDLIVFEKLLNTLLQMYEHQQEIKILATPARTEAEELRRLCQPDDSEYKDWRDFAQQTDQST